MIGSLVPRRPASGSYWPFFTVKEVLNVAESNFRFVPESGHSEYTSGGRSECLLMAESSRSLTVNMQVAAYFGGYRR